MSFIFASQLQRISKPEYPFLLPRFFNFPFPNNADAFLTCATHVKAFSNRERSPSVLGWKLHNLQFQFLILDCKWLVKASAKFRKGRHYWTESFAYIFPLLTSQGLLFIRSRLIWKDATYTQDCMNLLSSHLV